MTSTPQPPSMSPRVRDEVRRFDAHELAKLAGGLLLVPSNLHRAARIQTLANLVIDGKAQGSRRVTRTNARRLLDETLNEIVGGADDPWPTLATEAFVFIGGTHVFVPRSDDGLFCLRTLADCLRSPQLPEAFSRDANRALLAVATLSTTMLKRVGAVRNTRAPAPTSATTVPPEADLRRLMNAVSFTLAEIDSICRTANVLSADIFRLAAPGGSPLARSLSEPWDDEYLASRPLLMSASAVIVVAPHLLALAAIRIVLVLAAEAGVQGPLAEAFHKAAVGALDRGLSGMGMRRIATTRHFVETTDSIVSHALYQCDQDKVQHLMLASDALTGIEGDKLGAWSAPDLDVEFKASREPIASLLKSSTPPISKWKSIVSVANMGREGWTVAERHDRTCGFPASDLEAIAIVDYSCPRILWRYESALAELYERTRVMAWSPTDLYSFWRERGRRFQAPGEEDANFIVVECDTAEPLRRAAVERFDWHAIPARKAGFLVEVGRAGEAGERIYAPRRPNPEIIEYAVVTNGPVLWVVSAEHVNLSESTEGKEYLDVGRMLAFWLSQFSRELDALLRSDTRPVVIEYELPPIEEDQTTEPRVTREGNCVRLTIPHSFRTSYDDSNRSERQLVARVVEEVLYVLGVSEPASVVERSLDVVAPIGVKRMQHSVNELRRPSFIASDKLPTAKHVHECELWLAHRVARGDDPTSGALQGADAKTWLNVAVGRLYKELQGRLASTRPDAALQMLVRRHAALVKEGDLRDITFASQLACAIEPAAMQGTMRAEIGAHARTSMALRFLVEHVAAEAPTGEEVVGDSDLDEWTALAWEIVALGVASDVAEFKLSDVEVRRSRRSYEVMLGGFDIAMTTSRGAWMEERFLTERSRGRVPGATAREGGGEQSDELRALDMAMSSEYGHSLREVGEFIGEAIALAQERREPVVTDGVEGFVARLTARLGWMDEKVRAALALFSLGPRQRFLDPPAGFERAELWPWRFNRALSYLRRPFILTGQNVLFAAGAVFEASENLVMLCLDGRLKAKTTAMATAMGAFTSQASKAFVDRVAGSLRARGVRAEVNMRKFGHLLMRAPDGRDLGDVDVLAVDRSRRRLIALECKDFKMDRMPHEIHDDVRTLFDDIKHASAQTKHERRIEWLRSNAPAVARHLADDECGGEWNVVGGIVLSRALAAPMLRAARLPIWTFADVDKADWNP